MASWTTLLTKVLITLLYFLVVYLMISLFTDYKYSLFLSIALTVFTTYCFRKTVRVINGIYVNLGGSLVPLSLSITITILLWLNDLIGIGYVFLLFLSIVLVFLGSNYIKGYGIGAVLLHVLLVNSGLSAIYIDYKDLNILYTVPIAYTFSVYSVLIGIDLLKVLYIKRKYLYENISFEIGGLRIYDLILLSSILSPSLALALVIIGEGI